LNSASVQWLKYKGTKNLASLAAANDSLRASLEQAQSMGSVVENIDDHNCYPRLRVEDVTLQTAMVASLKKIEKTATDVHASQTKRLNAHIKQLDSRLNAQKDLLEKRLTAVDERAQSSFDLIENIRTRILNELTGEEGELKKRTTSMESELKVLLDGVKKYHDEKTGEVDSLLQEINVTSERLALLTQDKAASTMIEEFKSAAKEADTSAKWWTFAFLVFGVSAAIGFGYLIQAVPVPDVSSGDMGWVTIFGRLSLTATVAYLLGYSGIQATRQRNAKLYFNRMAIEMVSLDAYLSPYEPETALKIKGELMKAYFGKVTAPGYQAEGTLPSLDIVKHVTDAIAARSKDSKDDAKKDDAKGDNSVDIAMQLTAKSAPTNEEKSTPGS
jgi:hypothetical protein